MTRLLCLALIAILVSACQSISHRESSDPAEPDVPPRTHLGKAYFLAQGDILDVIIHTAPELNRTLTIAPDGHLHVPYAGAIPAAGLPLESVRDQIQEALSRELRDPDLDLLLISTVAPRIYVGGDVADPGMFDLTEKINPLQAIQMAGGVAATGQPHTILLLRRLAQGRSKSVIFDLKAGADGPVPVDWSPLRGFDLVYVSRERIADQDAFVRQYLRDALPLDFFLVYDIAD